MLIPTVNHNYIAGYDPERHLLPEDIDHTDLQNVGTTSHADIDLHIGSEVNPHNVGMSQLSNQDTGAIQFDLDNTITPAVGELRWNDDIGTLQLGMPGEHVVLDIGREELIKVGNDEGSLITDGSAVYISDSQGNKPVVKLARADSLSTARVIGLATEDITTGGFNGFVCSRGMVRGVNTTSAGIANGETWAEGDVVYLSATNAGKLTNVMPDAPNYAQRVGIVTNVHQTQGSIYIHIEHSTSITELADVDGKLLDTNGQILVWDNDNKYFDPAYNIEDFVPYTGADKDVDLGVYNITAANLDITGWNAKWNYDEDTIKGIKVDNASNADTVNNLNVETAVPLGALFTDTTYEAGDGISLSGTTINNTDKGSDVDLSGLVPYTGADKDVDLGENTLKSGTMIGVSGKYTAHTGAGLLFGTAVELVAGDNSEIICGNELGGSFFGGLAGGFVEDHSFIESSGYSSFAGGCATEYSIITSSGSGSFAQGYSVFYASLTSSGAGSFAQGYCHDGDITASGFGSFAQGYTTWPDTGIIASAKNAVQFGPGTNAIADNLQVGTGLSLYGRPSTPPTLRNGMIWQDNNNIYARINGVSKQLDNPDLSGYVPYTGSTTNVDLGENDLYVGGELGIGTSAPSEKLEVAGNIKATGSIIGNIPITEQIADYTLSLTDAGSFIDIYNDVTQIDITVPLDATVNFPIGTQILIRQKGTQYITIFGEIEGVNEVEIQSAATDNQTTEQYSVAMLIKVAVDTWSLSGDII